MKKKVLALIATVLTSLIFCIYLLQDNHKVKQSLVDTLIPLLEKEWNVSICHKSCSLNFFTQSLTLDEVRIYPKKYPKTFWGFKKSKISINFLKLILKNNYELQLTFYDAIAGTQINNNNCELIDHISTILMPSSSETQPITIDCITIHNGVLEVAINKTFFTGIVQGNFIFTKKINTENKDYWEGSLDLFNSKLLIDNNLFINNINGSSTFTKKENIDWTTASSYSFKQLDTPHYDYRLTGSWGPIQKKYTIKNNTTTDLTLNFYNLNSFQVNGITSLDEFFYCYKLLNNNAIASLPIIKGNCDLNVTIKDWLTVSGSTNITNIVHNSIPINTCSLNNMLLSSTSFTTDIECLFYEDKKITGNINWNFLDQAGSCFIKNLSTINFFNVKNTLANGWSINQGDGNLHLNFSKDGKNTGIFQALLTNEASNCTENHTGTITLENNKLECFGSKKNYSYELLCNLEPIPHIIKVSYLSELDCEPIIALNSDANNSLLLEGSIRYTFLESLMPQHFQHILLGKNNSVFITINQKNTNLITGSITTKNGKFCIPEINNLVKKINTNFTFDTTIKQLRLENSRIEFSKGSIECPLFSYNFSSNSYNEDFFYAPLQINNLLINWKKDFFSFIYGTLIVSKKPDDIINISGNIVLKKTLVKGDFSSNTENSSSFLLPQTATPSVGVPLRFTIDVNNEKPILIKTPLLQAQATLDLQASYEHTMTSLNYPKITGHIDIDGGFLNFLENKLFIEYGKIQFLTSHPDDAIIDLIAKNRINKYTISLQATGALKKPTIIFESTPELTEEQILSLLLAGSENANLQNDLPIMLMQNLNTYLLNHQKQTDPTSKIIKFLSKPLKYIQISPDFTDQNGHKNIKGIVSVALNKQIKAQLQKNLNFQDDFGFHLEYLLSDDVNLKFVKDQHGEIGSELEVKFKF